MHINDIRNIQEYTRIVGDIQKEDREKIEDARKAGFYWTDYQYDEENQRLVSNIRRVKNYTVANLYVLIGYTLQSFGQTGSGTMGGQHLNNSGGGTAIGISQLAGTINVNSVGVAATQTGISPLPPQIRAGTDTTTPSSANLGDIVTPASPTPNSNSLTLNYSLTSASLQWVATWTAGSFGAAGSTNIGEFGLCTLSATSTLSVLYNRLAVADANVGFTSPISVNNLASYGVTITLVI